MSNPEVNNKLTNCFNSRFLSDIYSKLHLIHVLFKHRSLHVSLNKLFPLQIMDDSAPQFGIFKTVGIWTQFLRSKCGGKAKCMICGNIMLTKNASTTSLHNHIKKKHGEYVNHQNSGSITVILPRKEANRGILNPN